MIKNCIKGENGTLFFSQPVPARNARTSVHRPPDPGNPATLEPNTENTLRPSSRKDRFSTRAFYRTHSRKPTVILTHCEQEAPSSGYT